MASGLGRRLTGIRGLAAVAAAGGLLAGGVVVPAQAARRPGAPPLPSIRPAAGVGTLSVRKPHVRKAPPPYRPVRASWPAAGWASIGLAAGRAPLTGAGHAVQTPLTSGEPVARGAGTPVWAQAISGVRGVRVHVLGHAAALAAGVRGVVFTARSRAGSGGWVRLGIGYAGFAQVSGGNYGLGLGLVRLPACALTTPRRPACQTETSLASVNDPAAQEVSAVVALPGARAARGAAGSSGGGMVLAAAPTFSDGGDSAGTYNATSLRPSGTWSEGGSTGSFDYSYSLTVPPAASSLVPSLSLNYDSGTVDGQTAATQAQASWVGDGWTLSGTAFIEQSFVPCQDSPEGSAAPKSTPDECYDGPVITLSQAGASGPLVCPVPFSYTANSTCKGADDNGEVITHHVSSGNGSGTKFTDYWTVTGRDGTTYYYGLNHLPGWASGDPATNSADSVPVFSAHSGDPCYSSSGFGSSACTMAYRWNLDYVTDVHGNAMAYYYKQDTNAYAENGNTSSATSYVRDSHLDHIDYGFTAGNAYTGHAPDQVVFTTGDRCVSGTCDPLNSTNAKNWPDVPYTQDNCAAGASCQVTAPTFWSTVRLGRGAALPAITTQQWNGSAYVVADSWALAQNFPATGDGTSPALFLDSITRTGSDTSAGGSAVTLPEVSFTPVQLANRVNPGNYPSLVRNRIGDITTETGSVIGVTYELTSPCNPSSFPTQSGNHSSCFPVYWQQFTPPTPDWFNKYAVQSVSVSDPTGGSPGTYTSYSYNGAAWHYDDNELVQPKYRTYGQWRGYQDVKTFTGTGTDAKTEAETTYYQGMSDNNNTTAVLLPDSQNGQHDDTNQLAGSPLESTVYNFAGGPVDHSTIYSYWVSSPAATRTRSGLPDLTANATGLVETWARQAITDNGATTWRKTETDTSYDTSTSSATFGLPLFTFSHGDLSQPAQQTCTSIAYTAANTSENLAGLPAETETDAAACGGSNPGGASAPGSGQVNALTAPSGLSRPAQVISDTRTFYDDPPVLTGGVPGPSNTTWPQAAPTKGDSSVVQKATNYAGGAFAYQTTSAAAFDSSGRPTSAYDANGNLTTTAYTMTNGVTTQVKVTNPLGQATTTSYDPVRGLPVTVTDANGLTTTLHYDGLGLLTSVWKFGRATSSPANDIYSYAVSATAPTVVTTQTLNDESGYVTSTALYDALLRIRQTQSPTPQGGSLVTDHFYDSRGWEWKTNHNWWNKGANPGTCPGSSSPSSPCVWTIPDSQVPNQDVTAFDGLGRPVLVTSYDDSAVRSVTATAYYGDRVTTVPPAGGTPTSTVTDALGRTTELDQYTAAPAVTTSTSNNITTVTISGGTTQATDYSYNTRGKLSDIKDASSSQDWTKTYNLLGQITGTTDPNGGASSDSYDNNGNLTAATDASGHTISYSYDALNRKTGEYDGPTTASPQIASWVYDNSNNAVSGMTDPIGHLTTETSDNGGNAYTLQEKGFNAFGESLGQTLTLPQAEGNLAGTYTLTHLYSATTGLLLRDFYPASPGGGALPAETVTHGYESGFDLPQGLTGLAAYGQTVTYDAFFQVSQEEIGSTSANAYITSTYDPHTGALTDSQTENSAVSTTPFDDTSYKYDPAGNITSQTDARNGTTSETQCFGYDTLDRLTQAWTATDSCAADPSANSGSTVGDQIPGSAYWTTWTFDSLGNGTSETDHSLTGGQNTVTSYSYNGNGASQPDTLTSSTTTGPFGNSSASYTYDKDGNTTARTLPGGSQTLTWTHDGKIATDTTPAGTTSYVYDANGNLLLAKDPAQTTLYLFGGTEQLVLTTGGTITGSRFLPLPGGGQVVRTGAGTSYTFELTDQHGTGTLTLDPTLKNPAWRQYTPYGTPRGTPPGSWPDTNSFLGKPQDANTGLDIVGARNYDPVTGRFLSLDPILNPASPQELNGYTYAADNPVTSSDPTGLRVDPQSGGYCPSSEPGCPGYTYTPPPAPNPSPGGLPCTPFCHFGPPPQTGTSNTGSTSPMPLGDAVLPPAARPAYARFLHTWQPFYGDVGVVGVLDSLDTFCGSNLNLCGTHVFITIWSAYTHASGVGMLGLADLHLIGRLIVAGCGGMSFTAGTKVLLASGAAVPIASLKPGEKILATNTRTGITQAERVAAILVHHDTNRYDLTVKTAHGTAVIHTTSTHLFWNAATRHWVKAASLARGSHLRTPADTTVSVIGGRIPPRASGLMWDLTVTADHDFYVDTAVGPILVHNCSYIWPRSLPVRTYQTYTKVNPETGQVYAGKTGGYGSPEKNVAARDLKHGGLNDEGFEPAVLDQTSDNPGAISGREQMLIDYYRELGISANVDEAVSPVSANYEAYMWEALQEFGWAPAELP